MRNLCPGCRRQPCTCAIEKDPEWLTRINRDLEEFVRRGQLAQRAADRILKLEK